MAKLRVTVLMGGRSPEYDVSLVSGREVAFNLDKSKYQVTPVVISPDGLDWQIKSLTWLKKFNPKIKRHWAKTFFKTKKTLSLPRFRSPPDIFFIAMHGPFGEDGTVQGILEFIGAKYTGSGVFASALGMDKIAFRRYLAGAGISLPKWVSASEKNLLKKIIQFGPPWVVKPSNQGSSVGVSIVKNKLRLKPAIKKAAQFGGEVIVEEYLLGTEVSCGVLGNRNPWPLPVIEICPKKDFFDYEAKYTPGMCEEIVPARIDQELTEKVQKTAVEVFKLVGARGFSRVDMILKDGQPYVLEINTIPGLTPNSLLPKEAKAAGISYPKLLDLIISFALEDN